MTAGEAPKQQGWHGIRSSIRASGYRLNPGCEPAPWLQSPGDRDGGIGGKQARTSA